MQRISKQRNIIVNRVLKLLLISVGSVFLALGVIGIFLPILPTTPFLLLAAACYARSSKRFYDWLMNNKMFGSFVKNYRDGRGVPLKVKIFTLSLLWITIVFSVFVINTNSLVKIILVIIAFGVSVHILTIKTYQ